MPPSVDRTPLSARLAVGVGHPVEPVSDVRGTDARRRERDRPEGVTQGFQVSVYKVDPRACVFARNLLSKDCCRAALFDEMVEVWPEVPLVIKPNSFACLAERLARATSGPYRSRVLPASHSESVGPNSDPGKEVTLDEPFDVERVNVLNTSFVDLSRGDVSSSDEVS